MLHEPCAGSRTIALPQSETAALLAQVKEERSTDVYRIVHVCVGGAGSEVFDDTGPRCRPVALPKLRRIGAVAGVEEKGPAKVCEVCGRRTGRRTRNVADITNDFGVRGRAIAPPELVAMGAVVGAKE